MIENYGKILCFWRKKRRYSQLSFSLCANVSARHVSFLESGRANPSREMILQLADHLDMPKSEVNRALLSAGYSPAYKARLESDADLTPIKKAIQTLITNHMPYPAFGMDKSWNITLANPAAIKLMNSIGFEGKTNLLEALIEQTREKSRIINWDEVVGLLLLRARAEQEYGEENKQLQQLIQRLNIHFNKYSNDHTVDRSLAVLPAQFKIDGKTLSLFSTIAQFGTVQDINMSDLKVELMFPMDQASEEYFHNT